MVAELCLVSPVDFITLLHSAEFASAALLAFLNIALVAVLSYAYWRSRRGLFLLLLAGNLADLYMNAFAMVIAIYGATHLRLFSPPTMRVLSSFYMFVGATGGVLSFIGTILLVRLGLSRCDTVQT